MAEEKFRDARGGIGGGGRAKGEVILARGFDGEDSEEHGVGVVNVEHEAGDEGENQPLAERARGARLVPIRKKQSNGESRMRVGPRRIEIHVDGERAGPPDGEGGEERPALCDILASEAEGQEQAEETIESGRQGHGDAVGSRETVGGDGGTQGVREKDTGMREEKKRHPKNRGADGEMVFEVAGGSTKVGPGLVIFVEARAAEAFVGMLIVFGEIKTVFD